jgi:uncharacterized protein YjiS (DUF1127 family)
MTACRTHRQVNAGRVPRYAPLSISGTREVARRVTTVALISGAGILRQHTQGRLSRANSFRERSMQFDKQFHGGRSPFALARRGNKASRDSIHLTTEINALPASSEDDAPRRSTVAAAWQLKVKIVAGFTACAAVAFPNFLLAVVSWTFAQALAGCAAYGEATYPGLVGVGEPVDQRDPVRGTRSEHGNPNQLQSRTSGLSETSPIANDGIRGRRPFLVSRQTQSSATALVKTGSVERSEAPRAASTGWRAFITSFLARFRSRIRRGRDSRLAIAELRALDDRRLRDIGISRCDIEHPAGRGDRCE